MSEPATNVSDREVGDLVAVLRLLADDVRVRILLLLASHGEMTVGRLSAELSKRQPLVSHHLGLMRSGSLVCSRRDGRNVYYSLAETVGGVVGGHECVCVTGTAGGCVGVRLGGGGGDGLSGAGSKRVGAVGCALARDEHCLGPE